MVLALDPRITRVWRTPHCLQFGVDEPVLVLDGVTAAEERMLAALAAGVTDEGLRLVERNAGAASDGANALLARITPVLLPERRAPPPPLRVAVEGAGPTVDALLAMLAEAGVGVVARSAWPDDVVDELAERTDAVVLAAAYAVEPRRHARWVRRDVPHLPIVFGDGGVTIGPLVRPGRGACLRCVELHRAAADPAWPAMATQLHTRSAPGETGVVAAAVAARAVRMLQAMHRGGTGDAGHGRSARLATDAVEWVSRAWEPHPECGCLGLPP